MSVLKASTAIIQKLQNKTLSKDNFFLRYTDNETEKSFQSQELNMTLRNQEKRLILSISKPFRGLFTYTSVGRDNNPCQE